MKTKKKKKKSKHNQKVSKPKVIIIEESPDYRRDNNHKPTKYHKLHNDPGGCISLCLCLGGCITGCCNGFWGCLGECCTACCKSCCDTCCTQECCLACFCCCCKECCIPMVGDMIRRKWKCFIEMKIFIEEIKLKWLFCCIYSSDWWFVMKNIFFFIY